MPSAATRVPGQGLGSRAVRGGLAVLLVLLVAVAASVPAIAGPQLSFDLKSGRVYYQKDATKSWHPASVTKLMTAYVVFRAIREGRISLKSPVVVSKNALAEGGRKIGLPAGTVITLDNALKMMIVRSANDIAVAIGEAVSGSEPAFVAEMNLVSRQLGMRNTRWTNPNGMPDDRQITTALDIGILVRAIRTEFPEYRGLFQYSAIKLHGRTLRSANRPLLERYRGADGMKTGYICASGLNVAATATRNGRTVVAIVFGARSGHERAHLAKKLLDRGFGSKGLFAGPRTTINTIRRPAGVGPARNVCRKNGPKPSIESLIAETRTKPRFGVASAFQASRTGDRDLVRIYPAPDTGKTSKKNGKKKKQDPYTLIVGPVIRTTAPAAVALGGVDPAAPQGRRPSPLVALEPGVKTSAPGETPLPKMRPTLTIDGDVPVASESAVAAAKDLAVPRPKPAR